MSKPDHYQIVAFHSDESQMVMYTTFDLERAKERFNILQEALESHDESTIFKDSGWSFIELQAVEILRM